MFSSYKVYHVHLISLVCEHANVLELEYHVTYNTVLYNQSLCMNMRVTSGCQFRSDCDCDCSGSDSSPSGSNLNHVETKSYTGGFALPVGPHDPDVSIVSTQFKRKNFSATTWLMHMS